MFTKPLLFLFYRHKLIILITIIGIWYNYIIIINNISYAITILLSFTNRYIPKWLNVY